ncbi:MAG: c-type cytochrome [Gammaproteobacteria bacterium]|nr:c-type cytochrome [Gammaproteobacteria bacterium]
MNSMRLDHAGKALFATIALLLVAPALADGGDAQRGRKLAYSCMGCHGIENYKNAYPKYSVPKLGGQSATYIAAALAAYQTGARSHLTMKGMASTLSAQDCADLAAWFQGPQRASSDAMPVGTLPSVATACTACHGQDGVGILPENPTLAGQHADYLAQALNDYRLGKRRNPIMGTFAGQLTRDDIQALAAYFSSQPGLVTPKR